MEGWLQVPPDRNFIVGRSGWKTRYVRFSNISVGAPAPKDARPATVTVVGSTAGRPTTSGSGSSLLNMGGSVGSASGSVWKAGLERSNSTHQMSTLVKTASASCAGPIDSQSWTLAIYKQKTDVDPILRVPITRIASCYVGDMATSKKKSTVQPTLVVNMRHEAARPPPTMSSTSSTSSTRSVRRRSQEAPPPRESVFRREGSAYPILLFRPAPESMHSLDDWRTAIQQRLNTPPMHRAHSSVTEYEKFASADPKSVTAPASPSSLFLVNGEPNTALLSPSIRSKSSNISSVESSDGRESYISSTSEALSSPRFPDATKPSHFSTHSPRPVLHLRTGSHRMPDPPPTPPESSNTLPPLPAGKRETILDRFFATAPPTPADIIKPDGKPISSIARFEALMSDRDQKARLSMPSRTTSQPVSRPESPPAPPTPPPPLPERRAPVRMVDPEPDYDSEDDEFARRGSDVSVDTVQSTLTQGSTNFNHVLQPPQSKRHSLADFSMMNRSPLRSPSFGGRRGSWAGEGVEEKVEEESEEEQGSREGVPIRDEGVMLEFSGRRRVESDVTPVFRDFKF